MNCFLLILNIIFKKYVLKFYTLWGVKIKIQHFFCSFLISHLANWVRLNILAKKTVKEFATRAKTAVRTKQTPELNGQMARFSCQDLDCTGRVKLFMLKLTQNTIIG